MASPTTTLTSVTKTRFVGGNSYFWSGPTRSHQPESAGFAEQLPVDPWAANPGSITRRSLPPINNVLEILLTGIEVRTWRPFSALPPFLGDTEPGQVTWPGSALKNPLVLTGVWNPLRSWDSEEGIQGRPPSRARLRVGSRCQPQSNRKLGPT